MLKHASAPRLGRLAIWNTLTGTAAALALSLVLTHTAAAQQSSLIYPTMDLDNDGRVGVDDFIEYTTLRQSGSQLADLNFDGSINIDDDAIAVGSIGSVWPVPRSFTLHWSVTGENDPRVTPVSLGGVEIVRDVEVIYQPNVPLYPVSGYHDMILIASGSYYDWFSSYNIYMSNYLSHVRS